MSETTSPDTTTTATTRVQLSELLEALSPRLEAFKSSIVDATDDETVINTAEGLWTVVDEAIDLLEPIDLEGLPKAINPDELPDAINTEKLSTAIDTGDAGDAIDLAELYEAVDLRELWKTVDLPVLRKEHKELAVAIEAFREMNGEDATESDEDETAVDDVTTVLFSAESRQQALQQYIGDAIDAFRIELFKTHASIRDLYESNQRRIGHTGCRSRSANPTARTLLSGGPLPDSISTRVSTVPRRVRHSRTKGRSRIYGRRFNRVGR